MLKFSVTRVGDFLHFGQLYYPFATMNLPISLTFLGNFCKGVKIYHFSSEILFGQLLKTFGDFNLVTLLKFKERQTSVNKQCTTYYSFYIKSLR